MITKDNNYNLTDIMNEDLLKRSDRKSFEIYSTYDGVDDSIKQINMLSALYPNKYPYIYGAVYKFDRTFTTWRKKYTTISLGAIGVVNGAQQKIQLSVNNFDSDDGIYIELIFRDINGVQVKEVRSNVLSNNEANVLEWNIESLPITSKTVDISIVKATTKVAKNMNISIGWLSWFNNYITEKRLTSVKDNTEIDSDDWRIALDVDKVEDYSMYGYIYDYVYDADSRQGNSFWLENNSRYLSNKAASPIEITVHGPATNPYWELIQDSKIVQSDGFSITIPKDFKLVVSNIPNEQKAVMVDPYGNETNVYQQQDLTKTNFVTIPIGNSLLVFYGASRISYKYREERVVV